ncbi:hypothetical protein [Phenylobacterium sp.]|jgi:hypothetical protein|uniref:hypothetical protein n=1 Tax=Phenylobacterium sp. TaxID=1871053 RepID=UPI0037C6CD8E
MSKFETRFAAYADPERIHAAFYGFIERNADTADADADAQIRTEIGDDGRRLCVRLWSASAMDAFLKGLSGTDRSRKSRGHD